MAAATTMKTEQEELEQGLYQLDIDGETYLANVYMTLLGKYPDNKERLVAQILGGCPSFPYTVKGLMRQGAVFTFLKK
jgi:hypothetical protein